MLKNREKNRMENRGKNNIYRHYFCKGKLLIQTEIVYPLTGFLTEKAPNCSSTAVQEGIKKKLFI